MERKEIIFLHFTPLHINSSGCEVYPPFVYVVGPLISTLFHYTIIVLYSPRFVLTSRAGVR